jgi:hypothetical protein
MGKNYDTDAERRNIDVWICKTCGKLWPVKSRDKKWTEADAEKAARTCCSTNSPCFVCGVNRTRYPHHACDGCRAIRKRERWERCEVKPLEFPITIQDNDRWFFDEDDLLDYCDENNVEPGDLLLRIGKRHTPRFFDPGDFWYDDMPEDDDLTEGDSECADLTEKINDWAKENIITYEMGPYRPDVSGLTREESE